MIEWSETHLQIREMFKRFVDEHVVPKIDDIELGDTPPYEVLRKMMATFGVGDMAMSKFNHDLEKEKKRALTGEPPPEKKKREGYSQEAADAAAMRAIPTIELSKYSPGMITALGVSVGLTAGAIQRKGTIAQKEKFVPALLTLEKIGAWAITEPSSGSDAFGSMKAVARRDGDHYVLNGQKIFITNGPYADTIVFICRLDDGVVEERAELALSPDEGNRAPSDEARIAARARADVLVVGEPGLGKSRLRRELASSLRAQDTTAALVTAIASPMESASPFALLRAIGRAAREAGLEPPALDEPARTAWVDLSVAVPSATDAAAIALLERADSSTRERAYLTALEGIARARGGELVLIVDDAHAIDLASAALLTWLLSVPDLGLALVLLGRPHAVEILGPLLRAPRSTTVRLGPFATAAALELARAISPELDAARLAAIVERAGGHALLLEELLRAPADDEASPSVLTVIERRISRLPAEARKALRAASLFGDRFWRSGVLAASGMRPQLLDESLGVLRDHELIVDSSICRYEGERELVFRHALVREAAYAMLTDADRAIGHRLVLGWLVARGERDDWLLAAHDEQAATTDLERAEASDRWYRIARSWPSHSESLHAIDHARQLVGAMRIPDEERLGEIDRSWLFQLAGGPDRTAVALKLREILAAARADGNHARTVGALSALVWTLAGLGEIEEARALEAEANLLSRGPRDRMTIAKAASMRAFLTNDLDEMARLTEEVVELADGLGKDDEIAGQLHNLGEIHLRKGRLAEGRRVLERSSGVASKHPDQQIFSELNLMLLAYVDAAETGTGGPIEPLRRAVERLKRGGLGFEELTARVFLGHALARRGEPALAIAELERAVECAIGVGYARYVDEARAAIAAIEAGTIPPLADV